MIEDRYHSLVIALSVTIAATISGIAAAVLFLVLQ